MRILGIESSCDECAASIVEDGQKIISNVIATQIARHAEFEGVVPEIASRLHTEWVYDVVNKSLTEANMSLADIDGIAVTAFPGLAGSLIVGVSFAKALAWSTNKPLIGVNHVLAHMYAPQLAKALEYPFLGLMVSGGHTMICKVLDFDKIEVMGTTIDDAVGEAFDKVAKHYGLGYPGGVVIDRLARLGNAKACKLPCPNLYKGEHRFDVSYSGLKTAVIYQLDQFWNPEFEKTKENIAASFEKAAIDMLISRLIKASDDTGITTIVAGGGVAANTYLRQKLAEKKNLDVYFPPLVLCGDNAAMVAGIGYKMLSRGDRSSMELNASPRVKAFKRGRV